MDKPVLQEVVVAAPAPAAASAGAKKSAGMPSADKEAGAATKTKKGTRDARQGRRRNPITRWAEDEQFQLWFPSHHPMYRFRDSEKSANNMQPKQTWWRGMMLGCPCASVNSYGLVSCTDTY